MLTPADLALLGYMRRKRIPLTRDNFIDLCYGQVKPHPWTAANEAALPSEFQDWARFKAEHGNIVEI
jgi:hypothetical protein